jgi:hypothetical protein
MGTKSDADWNKTGDEDRDLRSVKTAQAIM